MVKNVVGDVGQTFKLDWIFAKFDALRGTRLRSVVAMAMEIDVFEPKYGWFVINDELQSGLGSLANAMIEEILNEVAGLDLLTIFAFPTHEGTTFRLDVALAENVVKDVFHVHELFVQFNELDSGL